MEEDILQLVRDFKQTFGTEQGKRVHDKLKNLSNYTYTRIPSDIPIDPYRLAYDEGQRSVICYITNKVELELDQDNNEETVN